MTESRRNATQLLKECDQDGRPHLHQLFPSLYEELKALAGAQFRNQPKNHTLQPTALVNEAYVRLVERDLVDWKGRSHFKAIAAKAMRQILVDHHRARHADKRGGGWKRWSISGAQVTPDDELDTLALEEALEQLGELDERQAQLS